uniref:Tryptophan--tRNA ligase, mitochondrial n=1 Tax=Strigamia maritima TaxID=126957 RepID=T1JAT1_STRMM
MKSVCRQWIYYCFISNKKSAAGGIISIKNFDERIFSGIQPTGSLHLGNYFGAVKTWVELQNQGKSAVYSIVDLHSITMPQESQTLQKNIKIMAASLLACGIDPEKSTLFLQSQVPHHTQLSWVLGCMTTLARLDQLPQYREKSSKLKNVPLGLFIYPVLQSADILLYKATHVPVGEDQVQHLQITNHLARLFNNKYSRIFPVPQAIIGETMRSRLKSLRNPEKKMSKSEPDARSRIELTDSSDEIVEKVKKSVTDMTSKLTFDPQTRPGVSNLIAIHSLFTGLTPDEICEQNSSLDTGQYKFVVAECMCENVAPLRRKIQDYLDSPEYLEEILQKGAEKANRIANSTWNDVRNCIGFDFNNKIT